MRSGTYPSPPGSPTDSPDEAPNITAILARERCKTGWCINAVHTNNKKEVVQGLYTCGFDVLVTLPIGKLFLLPTASKPGWGTAKALVRDAINETTVNVQAQAGLRFFYLGGWMSTGIAFVTVNSESDLNLDFGGGTEAKVVAANLRVPYPTLVFGAVQELVNVSFSYASVHSAARTTTGPYPLVEDEKLAEGMLITIGISPIDAIKTLISSTAF